MKAMSLAAAGLLLGSAMSLGSAQAAPKKIDMITMTDTPQLLEVHDGIIKGLKQLGYVEGKDIQIDFKSAQGNFGTAQQIVRQFVGDRPT